MVSTKKDDPVCSLEQHRVEEIFKHHADNFEYLKKLKRLSKWFSPKKEGKLRDEKESKERNIRNSKCIRIQKLSVRKK